MVVGSRYCYAFGNKKTVPALATAAIGDEVLYAHAMLQCYVAKFEPILSVKCMAHTQRSYGAC